MPRPSRLARSRTAKKAWETRRKNRAEEIRRAGLKEYYVITYNASGRTGYHIILAKNKLEAERKASKKWKNIDRIERRRT